MGGRRRDTVGEAVWSGVHGHITLELTGFFGSVGRDPVRWYSEILTRMSIGVGDHALATARSLSTARRRGRPRRSRRGRVCTMSVAVTHRRTATSVAARPAPPPKKHGETPPPIAVSDIATCSH